MSVTWNGGEYPRFPRRDTLGWLRVGVKGLSLALVVFGGLLVLLALRAAEAPIHGRHRPWTPWITVAVCRAALGILGLPVEVAGRPMAREGAMVANHSSWLDIFVLNAQAPVYFVSKAEVARWPGIGWLARATGTVFIRRDRGEAKAQAKLFENRLGDGHRLVFFPEGTSTDGQRILSFKSTLFAAFFTERLRDATAIQPVTLRYAAPPEADRRFYGWWGEMGFGPHLLALMAAPRQGRVSVTFHDPIPVSELRDRKALAARAEAAVREAFTERRRETGDPS